MKEIKIELLGIATILLGITLATNNFFGFILGVLGFGVTVAGYFLKDKDRQLPVCRCSLAFGLPSGCHLQRAKRTREPPTGGRGSAPLERGSA